MQQPNENIDKRKLALQKNKLLRYKAIKELYSEKVKEHPHTPTTKILEIYIYPVFFISRTTLYQVLATPVTTKLRELEEMLQNSN